MPEREPMNPNKDEDKDLGPKEGEAIDEVPGVPNEELEQAHQEDAAKEAATKEQPEQ